MRKAIALALLAACTRRAPDPPRADPPPPSAAPSAAPAAERPAVDAGPVVAWTDERVTDGLATSCAFDPDDAGLPHVAPRPWHGSPLECRQPFEQACVSDPCFHEDEERCKATCQGTCVSCGDGCVKSCESCKATCKDAACRRRCAESCGKCRQDCLTTRDRCTSADCAEVYKTCRTKLVTDWLAQSCDRICNTCTQKCPNGDCPCWDTPQAKACRANPMLCPEMLWAEERKKIDPKWKANHCDEACAKIWKCAEDECSKSTSCGETIKMYERCAARIPEAGPCRLRQGAGILCPEPERAD
jgi:hypothetical protein